MTNSGKHPKAVKIVQITAVIQLDENGQIVQQSAAINSKQPRGWMFQQDAERSKYVLTVFK